MEQRSRDERAWTLVVIAGGCGSEREVSLASGREVAAALQGGGYRVRVCDLVVERLPEWLDPAQHLVIPMVHGNYGEDGRLSADLEAAGIAYAGSGPSASAICFDKVLCKQFARRAGLPVAAEVSLAAGQRIDCAVLAARLGFPFVLKPRADGSSCGLRRIASAEEAAAIGDWIPQVSYLAESYIDGSDLTVGIQDGAALEVVQIIPQGDALYDYAHKYTAGMSDYRVPAPLPTDVRARVQRHAEVVFDAVGCRDFARVDFRLSSAGELCFLEVNTLPGMTGTSLLPKSAAACGVGYLQLLEKWVAAARKRAPRTQSAAGSGRSETAKEGNRDGETEQQ